MRLLWMWFPSLQTISWMTLLSALLSLNDVSTKLISQLLFLSYCKTTTLTLIYFLCSFSHVYLNSMLRQDPNHWLLMARDWSNSTAHFGSLTHTTTDGSNWDLIKDRKKVLVSHLAETLAKISLKFNNEMVPLGGDCDSCVSCLRAQQC